jgi:hypothetical protein
VNVREVVILSEVAIYYEIAGEVAYVVAVLPMRRSPAWIRKKLKDRG